MAFQPAPNVAQAEIVFNMDGQRTQNVLHYVHGEDYNGLNLQNLANALHAYYSLTSVKGLYPSTCQVIEIKTTDMSQQDGEVRFAAGTFPIVGTRAGAQLPNNCALVLTKRTDKRGRSYRGRIYFGPLTETDVTGNVVAPAVVTSILGNLAGLPTITDSAAEVHSLVVLSRYLNNVQRAVALFQPVTSLTCDGVLDSQRRRLPGRGR